MYKLLYLASRNPAVSIEDWPRTWRSHAVYVSQFPAMETELCSLFYCCRIVGPALEGEPVHLPTVSSGHEGVAVVTSPKLSNLTESLVSPEDQLKVEADELRVFGQRVHGNIAFTCTESLVRPGTQGKAAVFRFLKAKDGVSRSEFNRAWEEHSRTERQILSRVNGAGLAARNELVRDPPAALPFDGIAETWFATSDDAVRSLIDGSQNEIVDSLAEFCDVDRTITMLTRVCHSWQQALAGEANPPPPGASRSRQIG
jgi:hypothetical protein